MMRRWLGWAAVIAQVFCSIAVAHAAEDTTPLACINVAKRAPDGTSSDRFLREWCQRNHGKAADSANSPTPDAAGTPQATEAPQAAAPVTPVSEPSTYPGYGADGLPDGLNSSRLPPGYHCHMLKFGERICHGGLD